MKLEDLLVMYEAVLDAPADGAPAPADPAVPDGGGSPAPADPGIGAADGQPEPASPAAPPPIDWASPEAQGALQQAIDQREQAQQQAQIEAEQAAAAQHEFSDVEEALSLLGLAPERFQAYLGRANAPLAQVAQQIEQQRVTEWVDGQLTGLGNAHPDLLGDGVTKLSELVNDDGQPLFNTGDVALSNKNAVLFAASALSSAAQQAGQQVDYAATMADGARQVAARDDLIGKIAVERFKQQIAAGGSAPHVPSGGGSGTTQLSGLEGGDELAVARRIVAERSR